MREIRAYLLQMLYRLGIAQESIAKYCSANVKMSVNEFEISVGHFQEMQKVFFVFILFSFRIPVAVFE